MMMSTSNKDEDEHDHSGFGDDDDFAATGADGLWSTSSSSSPATTTTTAAAMNNTSYNNATTQQPLTTNGVPTTSDPEPSSSSSSSYCRSCLNCSFTTLRFMNSFAVVIMVGLIVFLFFRVQSMNSQLVHQQSELSALELKLQNQTTTQIQELSEKVDQEQNLTLYQMAGTFTLLASLLTMFHMSSHLRNFYQPLIQRKIVAILWLSPIYAVTSFFSLVFPSADGYLAVIKDFYEAYAIFVFLSFLVNVLGKGDRDVAVQNLAQHASHLRKPTRCLRNCYHPPPETSDQAKANAVLTECQILCMQFVFVRPLTSIATFVYNTVMEQQHMGHTNTDSSDNTASSAGSEAVDFFKSPTFYIAMVTNASVFLAFTGLLKFYHAVREDLQWCQPFSKFMTIKGIVFLTFWQGLLISIIVQVWAKDDGASHLALATAAGDTINITGSDNDNDNTNHLYFGSNINSTGNGGDRILYEEQDQHAQQQSSASYDANNNDNTTSPKQQAAQIQNFLICLEMLFFSIAHWCVFPAEEWEPDYRPRHYAKPGIGLGDFVSDMSYIMASRTEARRAARSRANTDDENDGEHDNEKLEGTRGSSANYDDDNEVDEMFDTTADPSILENDEYRNYDQEKKVSAESEVELVPTMSTSSSTEHDII